MPRKVVVEVNGSSANLGPGFDTFAVAIDAFSDVVEAWIEPDSGGVVIDSIKGPYAQNIPLESNTAKRAADLVLQRVGYGGGLILRIYKGVPPGRGLGSSGASAAAGAIAAHLLLGSKLSLRELVEIAGDAEATVTGTPHYDNVSASILGGFVIVAKSGKRLYVDSLDLDARFLVAVPRVNVHQEKTRLMRSIIPSSIPLWKAANHWAKVALMINALHRGDLRLFGELMMSDEIVEHARSKYIPCYNEVKQAAVESGALGVSISGAGPSLIILVSMGEDHDRLARIRYSVEKAYRECGMKVDIYGCGVGGGYRVLVSDE